MAWGLDPVTGQYSTNPNVAPVLQGYQPGGALPAGFFDQMRSQFARPQDGKEFYDPATGYGFVPKYKESDGQFAFDGGTVYYGKDARAARDNVGLNGQPGYVYDASGKPTGQPFQFQGLHANSGLNNPLIGAAIPFALAGGAAALGLGGAGAGAGAAGEFAIPAGSAFTPATAAEMEAMGLGGAGVGGSGALGAGAAGSAGMMDLGGGLVMTPEGAIVGGSGAFAPATAAEMAGMGVSAGAAGGLSGLGGALTKAFGGGGAGGAAGGFDWTKLIGPGLSAVGGIAGANAAKSAAEIQAQSARDAQAKLEPWYQAGGNALARLQEELGLGPNTGAANYGRSARDFGMADFQTDPGYAFRQAEQQKGLERAASAQGGIGSGKFLKDAMSYSGGLASQEFGNAFNRFQTARTNRLNPLQSLAGQGQSTAQMVGDLSTQAGNAQAAGKVGQANALTSAIGQGYSMYQNQQQMDNNNSLMNLLLRRGV